MQAMKSILAAVLLVGLIGDGLTAAELLYTKPNAWTAAATTSSMRVAQFVVPRSVGDTADAELIVYYFGGSGGSVDANIDRWIRQMQQPDGRASSAVAKRSTRTVNGLSVTLVDVTGTYIAEMSPGSPQRHNSPNFRLRAVVVTTPNGPYFIKLTGPTATVAAADSAFEQFLSSIKYKP
jgi:hypothetical protein